MGSGSSLAVLTKEGENYDLGVWLTHASGEHDGETEHSDEEYAVNKVWDFAMQFARKTNVEWRVVFAKLGELSPPEMEGQLYFTFPQHFFLII